MWFSFISKFIHSTKTHCFSVSNTERGRNKNWTVPSMKLSTWMVRETLQHQERQVKGISLRAFHKKTEDELMRPKPHSDWGRSGLELRTSEARGRALPSALLVSTGAEVLLNHFSYTWVGIKSSARPASGQAAIHPDFPMTDTSWCPVAATALRGPGHPEMFTFPHGCVSSLPELGRLSATKWGKQCDSFTWRKGLKTLS